MKTSYTFTVAEREMVLRLNQDLLMAKRSLDVALQVIATQHSMEGFRLQENMYGLEPPEEPKDPMPGMGLRSVAPAHTHE